MKEIINNIQTKQFNVLWCMGKSLQGAEQTLTVGTLSFSSWMPVLRSSVWQPSAPHLQESLMGERYVLKPPVKLAAAKAVSAVPRVCSAGNLGSPQGQLCHCVLLSNICLSCSLKKSWSCC